VINGEMFMVRSLDHLADNILYKNEIGSVLPFVKIMRPLCHGMIQYTILWPRAIVWEQEHINPIYHDRIFHSY
jgi:hypothetical protein